MAFVPSVLISFALLAAAPTPSPAATPARLPAPAEAAFDKGLIAAQSQEWLLAIRYFEEARRAAPEALDPLFNQAVAESRVPGRELRATALFKAHLALAGDGPGGDAVRAQLPALEVRTDATLAKLIEQARKAAAAQPDYWWWWEIVTLQCLVGDFSGARQTAETLARDREAALVGVMQKQVEAGDVAGLEQSWEALVRIAAGREKALVSRGALQVGLGRARAGDVEGAERMVGSVIEAGERLAILLAMASAQRVRGKKDEALKTLGRAAKEAAQWKKKSTYAGPDRNLAYIAEAQLACGDLDAAKKTAALLSLPGTKSKADPYLDLGLYYEPAWEPITSATREQALRLVNAGDESGAKKLARDLPGKYRDDVLDSIKTRKERIEKYGPYKESLPSAPIPPDPKVVGRDAARNWIALVDGELSRPEFLDLPQVIEAAASRRTPKEIFDALSESIKWVAGGRAKIREIDAELAAEASPP